MMTLEGILEARLVLGTRVRRLRKDQRLTQEQLGNMIGVDRTRISRLETGQLNVTLDTLMLVSDCLGVSLSDLFTGISASPGETKGGLSLIFSITI